MMDGKKTFSSETTKPFSTRSIIRFNFSPTPEELEEIASILEGNFEIPQNFKTNTDVFDPNNDSNYAFRNAPGK